MKKKIIFAILIIVVIGLLGMRYLDKDDLDLTGAKVAILLTEEYDEKETAGVIKYLKNRGAVTSIVGLEYGSIKPYDKKNVLRDIDQLVKNVKSDDFDALVIPGGYSPAKLAKNKAVLKLVKDMVNKGKPCAAICHGPIVLAEAKVVKDREVTSHSGLESALKLNGATWINKKVVVDGSLITSRRPRDQRHFNAAIGLALSEIVETPWLLL